VVTSLENAFCLWYVYLEDISGGVASVMPLRATENVWWGPHFHKIW